jgi:hypothetical protein
VACVVNLYPKQWGKKYKARSEFELVAQVSGINSESDTKPDLPLGNCENLKIVGLAHSVTCL